MSSPVIIFVFTVVVLFSLMAMGFPIAFSLLAVSTVGTVIFFGPDLLFSLYSSIFSYLTKDILIAVPLFILMASILQISGIGERMYDTMYRWMGGLRGGLAIGTVLMCAVVAAMTGLAGTGTVMMGILAYPEMRRRSYNKGISIVSVLGGGLLGPIIPPSVPMIIISSLIGISVGKLFLSAIIPGLLLTALIVGYVAIKCFKNPELAPPIPLSERANWKEKIISLKGVIWPIVLICFVLGSIFSGVCTPTEAGGVGSLGALTFGISSKTVKWKNFSSALTTTLKVSSMSLWLVIAGAAFVSWCGISRINDLVKQLLISLPFDPMAIVILSLVVVFLLGMVLDSVAIMMITLPITFPIIVELNVDQLWYALIYSLVLILGMVTPPFGYSLFYFKGLGFQEVSMLDIYKSAWILIPIGFLLVTLCILLPGLVNWLPTLMI